MNIDLLVQPRGCGDPVPTEMHKAAACNSSTAVGVAMNPYRPPDARPPKYETLAAPGVSGFTRLFAEQIGSER